jgi:Bacterial Ig-like domain (group 1)
VRTMVKTIRLILGAMALSLLASCGGGGGCGGDSFGGSNCPPPPSSGSATVSVTISTDTVTAANPALVTAIVESEGGAPIAGVVVQFSTAGGLGAFSAPSALTDSEGVATVTLVPASASTSGADTVVATANVSGAAVTGQAGFQLAATDVGIASFASDLGSGALSAYGQTTLTVTLSDAPAGTPVNLSVASTCVTKGKATLTPATASTTNGAATFTYVDNGCGATEASDTVQLTVIGGTVSQALAIDLTSPNAASIAFVSATPERIYLKGSGYDEVSQVIFEVRDDAGNPLPGQSVSLEPTTLAGGLTLDGTSSAITKTSDSNGRVTVRINSGTVPTPVRVKATLDDSSTSTVSSGLAIAVGLPSQLNFSLSQQTINIEGFDRDRDRTPNSYTVIVSDRLGNPVPAGTTINFVVEGGGQIDTAKQIVIGANGLASTTANYQASEPRPVDGRITVLAYALGEESFLDRNGNNTFDSGEGFQDLGDVFVSRKFLPDFDAALDQFISLGISGSSACASREPDPADLLRTGVDIPSRTGTCDGVWSRAYVRRATETVLSTSTARPYVTRAFPGDVCVRPAITIPTDSVGGTGQFFDLSGSTILTGGALGGSFNFWMSDANTNRFNPVAAGSTITLKTSDGLSAEVLGGSPVPSTSFPTGASVGFTLDTGTTFGTVTVSITSPAGLTTSLGVNIDSAAVICP